MRILYIESVAGASGDMLLAALSGCGLDWETFKAPLEEGVPGLSMHLEESRSGAIACRRVTMTASADQPHRHLPDVLELIEGLELPLAVRRGAAEAFARLGEVEARAHGVSVDHVHFHEVGAVDSIMDVVGFHWALHLLGVERVEASPLKLGWGTVETEHGLLPVPVPAVAALVEGLPTEPGAEALELTTPTGALLIGQVAESWGCMPAMTVTACGVGRGGRERPFPNILRAWLGEREGFCAERESDHLEPCVVLETNVDDSTPEQLAYLRERLEEAGALDVTILSGLGKKGRVAHWLSVVSSEARREALVDVIFRHSTSLGVRQRRQERLCLRRRIVEVILEGEPLRVKLAWWRGELVHAEAEYEDCAALARRSARPLAEIQHAARQAALTAAATKS